MLQVSVYACVFMHGWISYGRQRISEITKCILSVLQLFTFDALTSVKISGQRGINPSSEASCFFDTVTNIYWVLSLNILYTEWLFLCEEVMVCSQDAIIAFLHRMELVAVRVFVHVCIITSREPFFWWLKRGIKCRTLCSKISLKNLPLAEWQSVIHVQYHWVAMLHQLRL